MNIIADMHTHSVASGHAYSTINELAAAAADRGLLAMALTDHGPALPGGPHGYHFAAMRFVPPRIAGVRVFLGVEANILDISGKPDLQESYLEKLDFVMTGFHENCGFDGQGVDKNTEAMINAMSNPFVRAISHPGNPVFPIHHEQVVQASLKTGTALEINNASFSQSRKGSGSNCASLAKLIARHRSPVVIGSDAHIAQGVGIFDDALRLLKEAGIGEDQVVNSSMERLLRFLGLPE